MACQPFKSSENSIWGNLSQEKPEKPEIVIQPLKHHELLSMLEPLSHWRTLKSLDNP